MQRWRPRGALPKGQSWVNSGLPVCVFLRRLPGVKARGVPLAGLKAEAYWQRQFSDSGSQAGVV